VSEILATRPPYASTYSAMLLGCGISMPSALSPSM
jgi:hypothetical protein